MQFTRPELPFHHPATLLVTWGGVGLIPKAPGTMGSLAALPFAYLIHSCLGNMVLLLASLAAFAVGWLACIVYMQGGSDDPKEVVIDEVAGQWLLLSLMYPNFLSYFLGFTLFRLFDVLKPWPVCLADRCIKGPFGVMLDDIMAACYPIVILILLGIFGNVLGLRMDMVAILAFLEAGYVF